MRESRQRGKRRRRRRRRRVESKKRVVPSDSDGDPRGRRRRRRAERVADDIARARQRASQGLCFAVFVVAVAAVARAELRQLESGFRSFSSGDLVFEFGGRGGQRRFGRLGATPRGLQRRLARGERLREFRALTPRRGERGDVIALLDQPRLFGVVDERHARFGSGSGFGLVGESRRRCVPVAGSIPAGGGSRQHGPRPGFQRGRARAAGLAVDALLGGGFAAADGDAPGAVVVAVQPRER